MAGMLAKLGLVLFPLMAGLSIAATAPVPPGCRLFFTEDVEVYEENGFPYFCSGVCSTPDCYVVGSPTEPGNAL